MISFSLFRQKAIRKMEDTDHFVNDFMDITGACFETAEKYLTNSKFQIDVAVNAFYENYAPISFSSSDEFNDIFISVGSSENRGKKRPNEVIDDDAEPLMISSDEEEDSVVFISEQKAKEPKLDLPGCSHRFNRELSPLMTSPPPPPIGEKRKILIDGSNVAIAFGKSFLGKDFDKHNRESFSVEGLETCIMYFKTKGFEVKAFVPEYRLKHDKSSNCRILQQMQEEGILIATPAKAYDDEILLESAVRFDAAVVSNDFFRDFRGKGFDNIINGRIIRYNVVFDEMILANDPYGRRGPKLNDILYCKN